MPPPRSQPRLPIAASERPKDATRTPLSGIRPKPLLASDALKEDVAPLEPATGVARAICGIASLSLAGIGVVLFLGLAGPGYSRLSAFECWSAATVLLLLVTKPVTYLVRAYAMFVLGAGVLGEALAHRGSAALLAPPGMWPWLGEATRVLAILALPGALLFRERYRAYPRARLLLAIAFAASLPFVATSVRAAILGDDLVLRATSILSIAAVLSSLVGFMGSETTAAGSACAAAIVLTLTAEVGARAISATEPATALGIAMTATTFLAASAIAAMGLFEMLAAAFARDAREIDVTKHEEPEDDSPPTAY